MANQQIQLKNKNGNVYPNPYWPVGSIFMSWNSTNPSTYFGGTWERITGGFVYGCVNSQGTGNIGSGTATNGHTLTIDQMPSHNHSTTENGHRVVTWDSGWNRSDAAENGVWNSNLQFNWSDTGYKGGGKAHSHNIPYIAVFLWKRTK